MSTARSPEAGLHIAIVGSGPAGMYAVEHLLEQRRQAVRVDVYDRLPTPWGLVRSGVAPDHPEKKLVAERLFRYALQDERVRFFGNVELGTHVSSADLAARYDAVVYAVGAGGERRLGVAGEGLPGSWSARAFVSHYNGHPDFATPRLELGHERAVIVGNGNVALDIARILTSPVPALARTDIAETALQALRASRVREVVILGRRGPLEAACHNPELEALEHLEGVDVRVEGATLEGLQAGGGLQGWQAARKVATFARLHARAAAPAHAQPAKRIVFRFFCTPQALLGHGRVEGLQLRQADGTLQTLDTGLVIRSIGYRTQPLPGLPFDSVNSVIRNAGGRVLDDGGRPVPRTYVTGWAKRGCKGVIGSNRACAHETVQHLLDDALRDGGPFQDRGDPAQALPPHVNLDGWRAIDRTERDAGRAQQRPRVKLTDWAALAAAAPASGAPA